jgi:hypothetical protein
MQSDVPHNTSKASRHVILNRDEGMPIDVPPLHHHVIHLRTHNHRRRPKTLQENPPQRRTLPTTCQQRDATDPRHAKISQPSATGAIDELTN